MPAGRILQAFFFGFSLRDSFEFTVFFSTRFSMADTSDFRFTRKFRFLEKEIFIFFSRILS